MPSKLRLKIIIITVFPPNIAPPLIIAPPSFWQQETYYHILKFYTLPTENNAF